MERIIKTVFIKVNDTDEYKNKFIELTNDNIGIDFKGSRFISIHEGKIIEG